MATVTKGSSYYYQDSKGGVSQVVGYESKTRRVCRTAFTVDSPCTDLTVKLYASKGDVSYRNCQIYIAVSESDSAYIGHTGTDGTFLGSWSANGTKTATITNLVMMPGTTYYLWFYHYADAFAWMYVTPGNITLTASGTPYTDFDLNGRLDGVSYNSLADANGTVFGTCDVYINGTLVADDEGDYHDPNLLMGSTYEYKDIKPTIGHTYNGVYSGSTSGTASGTQTHTYLTFDTNKLSMYYGADGGAITNPNYKEESNGWISNGSTIYLTQGKYGKDITLLSAEELGLVLPGYAFQGWSPYFNNGGMDKTTIYANGGTYSTSVFGTRTDKTATTANTANVYPVLIANWKSVEPQWTFNPTGGNAVNPMNVNAYSIQNLPTPTRPGYKFKRWYVDPLNDGPINLGMKYKYKNSFDIYLDAYMNDWSQFTTNMCLISCAETGGWQIYNSGAGPIEFIMFDSSAGEYKFVVSDLKWADLSPGWHNFRMLFDKTNGYMAGYVDNAFMGQVAITSVGYNLLNSVFLGAQASSSPEYPDQSLPVFSGYISNVKLWPSLVEPEPGRFMGTAMPTTFYAEWEPCDHVYIKVNNAWKLGTVIYKINDKWQLPAPKNSYAVETPPEADYGFVLNSAGYYENTNKFEDCDDTAALAKVTLNIVSPTVVKVNYIQNTEADYDYGLFSVLNSTLSPEPEYDGDEFYSCWGEYDDQGEGTISYGTLSPGIYTFYVKYQKDASEYEGDDSFQFKVLLN